MGLSWLTLAAHPFRRQTGEGCGLVAKSETEVDNSTRGEEEMRTTVLAILAALTSSYAFGVSPPGTLEDLRNNVARRYFEAAPHIALAKHHVDSGNRLLAFTICEDARRSIVSEKEFDEAFAKAFPSLRDEGGPPLDVDSEAEMKVFAMENPDTPAALLYRAMPLLRTKPEEAATLLEDGVKKWPLVGSLHYQLGVLAQDSKDDRTAEKHFVKAAELATNSVHVQSWVGRFFFKVKEDHERALSYYLRAYFLSPHAYETEYVEQRIQTTAMHASKEIVSKNGRDVKRLFHHASPAVVGRGVKLHRERLSQDDLLEMMRHDVRGIRWMATTTLLRHRERLPESKIQELLKGDDLRVKGLASYLWVDMKGANGFETVAPFIKTDVQLLQHDVVSALLMFGGRKGKEYVRQIPREILHPSVAKTLEAALK